MTKRSIVIPMVIIALSILCFFGFLIHYIDADDARQNKEAQDWLTFSMQHHCRVSKEDTFADPNTIWQCDGFEVRR